MPALWLCLLWQTPEPQRPQRQTARLRLLPLSGDRRLPLWGRAYLPEYAGTDGPVGPGRVARSLYLADAPRAARGRIPASLAARDAHQPHAAGHDRRPNQQA